jgi:hypothetical protein
VKIALYARVSTEDQTVAQQLDELRQICQRHGWGIVAEFSDVISGLKFTRQGLDEMMLLVRHRKVDLIACYKLDRLGRSLPHLAQIANLFVCDGSILPTQGSANPGLTIQALAARTADYLISQGTSVFTSDRRDMTPPPVRRELSPPGTHGVGVPRLG